MASGMQTFLKMAGLFGPEPQQDERFGDMPSTLPTNPMAPPLINRATSSQMPGTYEDLVEDDAIADNPLQTGNDQDLLAAFRQNVLNPPKREHMTYPKNTLAGLEAALKIAAEPLPSDKDRVYIGGVPHRKMKIYTDPVTGERNYMTNVKDPSFMDQVMRAMPAAVSAAPDILNAKHTDAVEDWKIRNAGLKDAVTAESNMALAQQREANARAIPQRLEQGQQRIDISRMTAEERARVSRLNTLTDAQKIEMLQDGRVSLAELQAAAAMKRVEAQQAGATQRTGMQQTGANYRTGVQQSGASSRNQASIDAANARNAATIAGAGARNAASIAARGAGGAGQYPTQQRVDIQRKTAEFLSANPDLEESITFDERGFPQINIDDPDLQDKVFQAIYGTPGKDINLPSPPTAVTPSGQTAPIGTPQMQMAPNAPVSTRPTAAPITPPAQAPKAPATNKAAPQQVIKQYSASRNQTRISTDGGKTWKVVEGRQ